MFLTARQLEDLHRRDGRDGRVTVPYRARLTPLAADYVRVRKLVVGYGPEQTNGTGGTEAPSTPVGTNALSTATSPSPTHGPFSDSKASGFLWWCDGPCGPVKAAVVAEEKQSALRALDIPADAGQIVQVIKRLSADVKSGSAAGGVLLVNNAARAMVFANRCPSLRAVLGTCLEAVEQGVRDMATNVLVIEHPHKTLQQTRNMLGRFLRAGRTLDEQVRRQLQEMASCG